MDNEGWWLKAVAYAAFGSVGGMLGHTLRTLDRKEKINWVRAVTEGLSAGFVGLLMFFLCDAMELSQQWTGVIVGVSGWMGATATIRVLEFFVQKKLNLTKAIDAPQEPK
jgi:hypothetical protein